MNVIWLLNRLRAMGPREVVWRVGEQAKRNLARRRLEGAERYRDTGDSIPVLPGLREALLACTADDRAAIAAAAERVLSGDFAALGMTWPKRDPKNPYPSELWQLDPVTGKGWPSDVYCFDIDYRHERELGDVKYVWEFNRLQFLQVLAADYALNPRPEGLAQIEQAIASWISANPPFKGVQYAETLNVAMRSISLLMVTSLCGDKLSPTTISGLRTLLRAHAFWLARYPSLFSSANNHLVGELAAEFIIAVGLGGSDLAGTRAKSWSHLMAEVDRQILADGIAAEQSPSYGAFTAEFVLLACFVARGSGIDVPRPAVERLLRFADAISWLASGEGRLPELCDNDEGRVIALCEDEPFYSFSVAAALRSFFGSPLPGKATPPPTLRRALFGVPARSKDDLTGAHLFADGGLTVVRERAAGRTYVLTFDHGPLGFLSIAAHGHADALSLTLSVDDAPLLVDPGTYLYHSGGEWRDWFRGTPAHNTLNIDGQNQSRITGSFNWGKRAVTTLEQFSGGKSWRVTASHDGYVEEFGVRHARTIAATPDGISVLDTLPGAPGHPVEIVFQLAPAVAASETDAGIVLTRGADTMAILSFDAPGTVRIATGGALGDGGWVSDTFGTKQPAPRITWTGNLPPDGLATRIALMPPDAARPVD